MKAVNAAKAAKASGVNPAAPPPSQRANQQVDCADPMLQGTYVSQDEIGVSGQDLDDFESKLAAGVPSHKIGAGRSKGATTAKGPDAKQQKAPLVAKPPARQPVASQSETGAAKVLTEEEEERLQDISDVRNLERDESSSDDE